MPTLLERIQKGWNAFRNKDPTPVKQDNSLFYYNSGSSYRPDRRKPIAGNERSIIMPILNRIAVDASQIDIRHVRLDDQKRYKEDIDGELNDIFCLEANLDQSAREFRQDVYASLLDEGYIAICPIVADINYATMTINKIKSVRVGKIKAWYPQEIDVELYNEWTGQRETVRMSKHICVIIQNPFYEIMNAPNSLMMRLRKKLALLDQIDERTASGKLDMIIQLPYSTRHETQRERAEERRRDLEVQLSGSKYGIGYIDASEKVIQLGRSLDNNLTGQIDTLTKQLQDQLGVSAEILSNSANESNELNYTNNIIEPLVTTLVEGIKRKWLTPTARSQGQSIMFFKDPFRYLTVNNVADIGDKLLRNQILTSNEMRGVLGFKPSDQEGADMLMNPNMPEEMQGNMMTEGGIDESTEIPEAMEEPEETEENEQIEDVDIMQYQVSELPEITTEDEEDVDVEKNQNGS